jgi:hypothetical protein
VVRSLRRASSAGRRMEDRVQLTGVRAAADPAVKTFRARSVCGNSLPAAPQALSTVKPGCHLATEQRHRPALRIRVIRSTQVTAADVRSQL